MNPELLDVGVAGVVVLLVLDKVVSLIKASRYKDGGIYQDTMTKLVEAVRVKNAVDVRLEHNDREIERLRDTVHTLRRDFQETILGYFRDR